MKILKDKKEIESDIKIRRKAKVVNSNEIWMIGYDPQLEDDDDFDDCDDEEEDMI